MSAAWEKEIDQAIEPHGRGQAAGFQSTPAGARRMDDAAMRSQPLP